MPALEQMKQMLLPLRLYILSPESRVYAELCAYAQGLPAQLKIWADIPAKSWDALDAADTAFHDWDALSLRWELQEENE